MGGLFNARGDMDQKYQEMALGKMWGWLKGATSCVLKPKAERSLAHAGIKISCSYKSISNSMEIKKYNCCPVSFVALSTTDEPDSISSQHKAIKRI